MHLDVSITQEACPLGLAPTASSTAALAMGDALAMALLGGAASRWTTSRCCIRAAAWAASSSAWRSACTRATHLPRVRAADADEGRAVRDDAATVSA